MTIVDIKHTAEQKMGKTIEAFKSELHKIRTGRAHPGLLDRCMSITTAPWCRSARLPT